MLCHLQFSSVQSLSHVQLFATPWTEARQASLSITNSQSLLKLTSITSVMPSNHLILCHPLFLLPSIFPSIRVFSNESVFHIRWPKYWSFMAYGASKYSSIFILMQKMFSQRSQNSNTLATRCKELTHWKRPWCWERLKAGEGDNRGWDGWMASLIKWKWPWANSRRWWEIAKPGMPAGHGVAKSWIWLSDLTTKNPKLSLDS